MNNIKSVVGFDQRESVAYDTFCQSVIEHASLPLTFLPLAIVTLKKGYSLDMFKQSEISSAARGHAGKAVAKVEQE